MKAKIINGTEFGGLYTIEFIEKNDTKDWVLTDVLPSSDLVKPSWDGTQWYDTYVPIIIVPETISRMKFKMQVRRSTIYSYDIILEYLKNLVVTESFDQDMKDDIIDRFEDCVIFERYSIDFITIANILSVSDEIKDEIFIEGNKIT